jgi:hypothetical protein
MFPKKWGDRASMEISGTDGKPLAPPMVTLSDDQEIALQNLIASTRESVRMQ